MTVSSTLPVRAYNQSRLWLLNNFRKSGMKLKSNQKSVGHSLNNHVTIAADFNPDQLLVIIIANRFHI